MPVPIERHSGASIVGPTPIRYWGDEPPPNTDFIINRVRKAVHRAFVAAGSPPEGVTTSILALSGGAWDGAYGAGLFAGWTACGTRPRFALVTGVSTGALLAPFVFLGPAYDARMRAAFTELDPEAAPMLRVFTALFGALGLTDTRPLRRYINRFATVEMLDAIAREYATGRNLLIGTTNLDAERPVTWNIGALATSGRPDRLQLFRDVLLASASVPGAFPPVLIDVELEDARYAELHVDGGVTNSVFLLPKNFDAAVFTAFPFPHRIDAYVVQNNKLGPQPKNIDLGLGAIVARAVGALIRGQNRGDIARIFLAAQRDGLEFHLASVPDDFTPGAGVEVGFNTAYMRAVFETGYAQGAAGHRWRTGPPGFDPPGAPPATKATQCAAHRTAGVAPESAG
ncbi:MAG: patatin-like phospholipase family protein [Pseudomonadota bacterium]